MRNVIVIGVVFLFISCTSKNLGMINVPSCLSAKIDSIKRNANVNPPQSIIQYSYKGAPVYYVTAGCCDQFNTVYNNKCEYLGAPDGGVTGKGDNKLPDFFANATNKKVVWENK